MDPITAIIGIAGMGMQLFGSGGSLFSGMQAAGYASQEAGVSENILGLQEKENTQRQLAMQISARRQSMETVRQTQMAQAKGLAAGVNQGAQFGSGVAGGQAQAAGQGGVNLLGINQNLQIGNTLFGLQNQISGQQMQMAQLQGQQATAQGQQAIFGGIASIGGSLSKSAGPLGNILGNFFGNSNDPSAASANPAMGGYGLGNAQFTGTGNLY